MIGQNLFYIEPAQTSFYAELTAGQRGFGKIKPGQQVKIKVESYARCRVWLFKWQSDYYIQHVTIKRDPFLIRVDLPDGLQTNYHKYIFFRNNLSAQAEIVTVDRRLMERFFSQLRQVWER